MIGKKAAIGIIAATGVVAVGVPVGIVVGQHASKTGSLDSKMQGKWSDIERELASSFGGFDVRNARDTSANQDKMDANLKLLTDAKDTLDKVIGTNPNTAYFNSFSAINKNFDKYVQYTKERYQNIIDNYAQACLQVANGVISKITYQSTNYTIDVEATTNVVKGIMTKITATPSTGTAKSFEIPFQVNLSIENSKVVSTIDDASFHSFIYGSAGQSPLGRFDVLVKDAMKPNNLLSIKQFIDQFKDLLKLEAVPTSSANPAPKTKATSSLRSFVTGEISNNTNKKLDYSFESGFGLFDLTTDFGDFSAAIASESDLIRKCNDEMKRNVLDLQFSLFGHHDEKLVDAAIKNLKDNLGVDFPPLAQDGKVIDVEVKDVAKIFDSKTFVLPNGAKVVGEDFLGETPNLAENNIASSDFDASRKAIDDFNKANTSEYTFTNEDRFKWFKESGLVFDIAETSQFFPGELAEKLSIFYKEYKMNYQTNKDWLNTNEFSLVWNHQLFRSILTKYNISANDATFEVNIENEGGNTYKLSVLPSGEIFVKASTDETVVSSNPLFSQAVTDEELTSYPLASSEWYTGDYNIAYSSKPKDVPYWKFEVNAPFVLNGNSKITFGITVVNREAGLTYTNTNGRKPDAFAMNQKGELYVHTDGDRG